jgi:hypothetical protein
MCLVILWKPSIILTADSVSSFSFLLFDLFVDVVHIIIQFYLLFVCFSSVLLFLYIFLSQPVADVFFRSIDSSVANVYLFVLVLVSFLLVLNYIIPVVVFQ